MFVFRQTWCWRRSWEVYILVLRQQQETVCHTEHSLSMWPQSLSPQWLISSQATPPNGVTPYRPSIHIHELPPLQASTTMVIFASIAYGSRNQRTHAIIFLESTTALHWLLIDILTQDTCKYVFFCLKSGIHLFCFLLGVCSKAGSEEIFALVLIKWIFLISVTPMARKGITNLIY